jgi:AraC-like DNA-binding protein
VLRVELVRDGCTAGAVAHLFLLSRWTLHRRLQADGRTYRQIADEVRFEIACMLLAKTDLPLSQVAAILKYSALSPFTRAFQHWSGQRPSAWRSSHRGFAGG